jgi:glycosyltransferase involved in cell wall biosynthesis
MNLSVIVTSYNEAGTILQAVSDAKAIAVNDKEIYVIDNCSADGTRELLQTINDPDVKVVLQDRNYGFGRSVELGLSLAKGEYTYIHHTDLEYDYKCVPDMISFAEINKLDIVLGSRIKAQEKANIALIQERPENIATIISTGLINWWFGKEFTDIIGSRLYKTEMIRKVPISTYGAGFDFESITRICMRKLNINEVAINYMPRTEKKGKKIKPYHMLNAIIAMFKVRYFEKAEEKC